MFSVVFSFYYINRVQAAIVLPDLNVTLLEEKIQQVCGSPAGVCFFSNALAQNTSCCTYNLPVCNCFTDLSNRVIALTFVPAERSKNCKSDHDHTFLLCPKNES